MSVATIRAAADYFGVPYDDMYGPIRLREYVYARFASYYVMRERDELSYLQIGRRFSKDHSTIIHGCRRADDLLRRDADFAAFVVAQMSLPKHSAAASILQSPYTPWEKPKAPAPVMWTLPVCLKPKLKPVAKVRVWEDIDLPSEHRMRLDQDGWTLDEIQTRNQIIAGSKMLAAAIKQARAA